MGEGADRNIPCWCGSGKKFKYCHRDRHLEEPQTTQDFLDTQKRLMQRKFCLLRGVHPTSCSKKIIKSHSIPVSSLRMIETDHRVLTVDTALPAVPKLGGKFRVRAIPASNASTFHGFCGVHDNLFFSPIEDTAFLAEPLQLCLLGYRAVCYELFLKQVHLGTIPHLRQDDRGCSPIRQRQIQGRLDITDEAVPASIRNLQHHKARYEECIIGGMEGRIRGLAIQLSKRPDLMSCGAFYPEVDFHGNFIQALGTTTRVLDLMSVSLFGYKQDGWMVLTWVGDSDPCTRFCDSFLTLDSRIQGSAFVQFLFAAIGNTFFSPSWWKELGPDLQSTLLDKYAEPMHPVHGVHPRMLIPDGRSYAEWNYRPHNLRY